MSDATGPATAFDVIDRKADVPRIEETATDSKEEQAADGEQKQQTASAAELAANAWVIATCVKALGNAAYVATRIEAAKCDDIAEPLGETWAPFLPLMSPITQALVVTVSLVAPKAALVIAELRRRKEQALPAPPPPPADSPKVSAS